MKTIKELNELARTNGDVSYLAVVLEDELRQRQNQIFQLRCELDALEPIYKRFGQGLEGAQLLRNLKLED